MKIIRWSVRAVLILVAVVAAAWLSTLPIGCEQASGTNALTVVPSYVDISSGIASNGTLTFTVTGGLRELSLPLEWSVSNPDLGEINSRGGNSASYVAYSASGNNTIYVRDQYDAEGVATVVQ